MIINENLKNTIVNDAAAAIINEIPDFVDWYEGLDEYQSLMESDFAKEYLGKIDEAAVSHDTTALGLRSINKLINGSTIDEQEIEELRERRDMLNAFTEFFKTAHAAYNLINGGVQTLASDITHEDWERASWSFREITEIKIKGISNPLKGINTAAINDELRATRRECSKIDAFMASRKKNIENFREFILSSSAMVGWGATALAVVYTAAKILKK